MREKRNKVQIQTQTIIFRSLKGRGQGTGGESYQIDFEAL